MTLFRFRCKTTQSEAQLCMDPLIFFLIGLSGILASMIVFDVGLPRRFREVFASRRENGLVWLETRWLEFKITSGYPHAQSDWTVPPGCADLQVTGTSFNLKTCIAFLDALDPETAFLDIECAKYLTDKHVPALRVLGYPSEKSTYAYFLGHVPANVAEQIAESYPQDWPLGACFTEAGLKTDRSAVSFTYSLLAKSAK